MKTINEIREIVDKISFRDWQFFVSDTNGYPWMQLEFAAEDVETGVIEIMKSGKELLSFHMCDNEIIRVAHMLIERALLHEMDEDFKYDGVRIFDPHMDYVSLAKCMKDGMIGQNVRISQ